MPKDDDDKDEDGDYVDFMILFGHVQRPTNQMKCTPEKNKRNKKMLIFTIKSTIMMDGLLVCKSYFHFFLLILLEIP